MHRASIEPSVGASVAGTDDLGLNDLREQGSRACHVLLLLVLFVGAFFRLYNLGAPYISEDEAYHAVVASSFADTGAPLPPSGQAYTRGMPVIVLDALAVRYLPVELETAVRLPTALLGILNIWLFFLLGSRYGGPKLGLVAATLFAVSPWCIWLGTMARMYELLLTASLLCLWAFERMLKTPSGKNSALLAFTLCLSVAAHELGILLILLPLAGMFVEIRHRRLIAALGIAVAAQLVFYKVYPAIIQLLFTNAGGPSVEPGGRSLFVEPAFGLQAVSHEVLWVWIAGSLALSLGAIVLLRGRSRNGWLSLIPWAALLLVLGAAGLLVAGALALAVFFALSSLSKESPATVRRHRIYLVGFYAATVSLWGFVAGFVAMSQGMQVGVQAFISAIRYPQVILGVIWPLVISPRSSGLLAAGVACLAVILVRIALKGPLLPGHTSLVARVLFLLGAITVVGVASPLYRDDRYLYFLLPAALLSLLELARAYWHVSTLPARAALAVLGLLTIGLIEVPGAMKELSDHDGRQKHPFLSFGLPDILRLEKQLAKERARRPLDYRAASQFLKGRVQDSDLIFVDAAHQFQAYLPGIRIDAHLSPRLSEYVSGERHYFTGSVLLREPEEMAPFLQTHNGGTPTRIWIALTGYDSPWQAVLPPLIADREVWKDGDIVIYSISAGELLGVLRCAEGSSLTGSKGRELEACLQYELDQSRPADPPIQTLSIGY